MLPESLKSLIGSSGEVRIYEVEKGAIRRFAAAVDDYNPAYHDDEFARNSKHGTIIAPPGFFGWPRNLPRNSPLAVDMPAELETAFEKAGYPLSLVLDGGMEYEYFLPVRAGDLLSGTTIVRTLRERSSETGSIILTVLDTVYTNQNKELVAKQQASFVRRSLSPQTKEQING